jgi:hypothetical protein
VWTSRLFRIGVSTIVAAETSMLDSRLSRPGIEDDLGVPIDTVGNKSLNTLEDFVLVRADWGRTRRQVSQRGRVESLYRFKFQLSVGVKIF